jgi:hypothetical protein
MWVAEKLADKLLDGTLLHKINFFEIFRKNNIISSNNSKFFSAFLIE